MDLETTLKRLLENSDEEVKEWSPTPFPPLPEGERVGVRA